MEQPAMNWAAIIVASLIPLITGFYYHPKVMGTFWLKSNGFDPEQMRGGNMGLVFGLTYVLSFMITLFLHANVTGPGQEAAQFGTFHHGVIHGTIITILVVFPILGIISLFEKRGWNWVLVHALYWWLTLSISAGILSAWR
jgi:hypothetical protein